MDHFATTSRRPRKTIDQPSAEFINSFGNNRHGANL